MTRSFYSHAIFFTGLYILITFFRSIIGFQLGARMNELQSLTGWITFEFLISLLWSLILLKYYHYRQYRFTFWVKAASIAVSLCQFILLYNLLTSRDLSGYYIVATLALMGTGIAYAISLIFSQAGKRPWLKASGVLLFFLGLVSIVSFVWAVSSVGARLNGTITQIEQWASLLASLGPALFIMHFRVERATPEKVNAARDESLKGRMGLAGMAAVVATLIFVPKVAVESMRLSRNPDQVSESVKTVAQLFSAKVYVNSTGDTMRYRLMLPLDYDSTRKYPLVVCLHGSSGCGTDNIRQIAASVPAQFLSAPGNRTKYPAFLFVPQCPLETAWGGIPDVPAVDSLVFESILALQKEFAIDAGRCYVAGNSLGGYGAWHLITARPEMFAAAIPICGGGNPALARNIVDVPVWAFHGAKDRLVPVRGSRDIIQAIKNAGGNPRYTEYPHEGHHILKKVTDTPGLLDWLFAQKRG
jgi:dienelactone hydrolase